MLLLVKMPIDCVNCVRCNLCMYGLMLNSFLLKINREVMNVITSEFVLNIN